MVINSEAELAAEYNFYRFILVTSALWILLSLPVFWRVFAGSRNFFLIQLLVLMAVAYTAFNLDNYFFKWTID